MYYTQEELSKQTWRRSNPIPEVPEFEWVEFDSASMSMRSGHYKGQTVCSGSLTPKDYPSIIERCRKIDEAGG